MRAVLAACVLLGSLLATACTTPPGHGWESRLRGDAVVLLGEVHDNAPLHRRRLQVLERALAGGWRPVIVMEQFDRERQADIERARRDRPGDPQHVIDAATTPARPGGGWNWDFYRPVVALALRYDLPLIAANLSRADTGRIARGGLATVFDESERVALGLDRPIAADWRLAQERAIDAGHCHALPPAAWPRMADAQFARDAVMTRMLRRHAAGGAVLLAGNGHVRRDLGVPRWLATDSPTPHRITPDRLLAIGFLEEGDDATPATAFDAVVRAPAAVRADPCAGFGAAPARP